LVDLTSITDFVTCIGNIVPIFEFIDWSFDDLIIVSLSNFPWHISVVVKSCRASRSVEALLDIWRRCKALSTFWFTGRWCISRCRFHMHAVKQFVLIKLDWWGWFVFLFRSFRDKPLRLSSSWTISCLLHNWVINFRLKASFSPFCLSAERVMLSSWRALELSSWTLLIFICFLNIASNVFKRWIPWESITYRWCITKIINCLKLRFRFIDGFKLRLWSWIKLNLFYWSSLRTSFYKIYIRAWLS